MFVKNVYITIWDFADSDEGEEVAKLKFKYLDLDTIEQVVYTIVEESDALFDDSIKVEVNFNYYPVNTVNESH
tara:strand:- start:9399 stop:9617 length:219 start_codon:yes stop_codon:yes gene_type:complete